MNKPAKGYLVAFRYKPSAGPYAGVVTWTAFKDKAAFDTWLSEQKDLEQEVVEEGISEERAQVLVKSSPLASFRAVAMHNATDPETGLINLSRLTAEAVKANAAIKHCST